MTKLFFGIMLAFIATFPAHAADAGLDNEILTIEVCDVAQPSVMSDLTFCTLLTGTYCGDKPLSAPFMTSRMYDPSPIEQDATLYVQVES